MLLHYNWFTTECSHTGLVPESPTFFNSSPFKVLSPQPPKFLKSLLPVKEENKAKKVLEARPLLGQEVSSLFLTREVLMSFYHVVPFPIERSFNPSCPCFVKPHVCILSFHLSYQITFPQHDRYTALTKKRLIVQSCLMIFVKMALLLRDWPKNKQTCVYVTLLK